MEEVVPVKIDWLEYKRRFPTTEVTWALPLKSGKKFWDRDLSSLNYYYTEVFRIFRKHIPADVRKALGTFIAATSTLSIESVNFKHYEEKAVNWLEEHETYEGVPLPSLDPKKMIKVNEAVALLESVDLEELISLAWSKCKDELEEEVGEYFAKPKNFCIYLGHWIDAFKEIHAEEAVLGLLSVS